MLMTRIKKHFLTAVLIVGAGSLGAAAEPSQWQELTTNLHKAIPGYRPVPDKLNNGIGNLTVLPATGELFVTMNRDFGMYRSSDAGETWNKVTAAPVQGRAYGGFSSTLDPQTGRFAVFMIVTGGQPGIGPVSALTLDGGKTWQPITKPAQGRHDGWTWGAVDWSLPQPKVIIGKQHHSQVVMWLSRDAGQTWEKLPFLSRNPGIIDANTFVACKGDTGDGIWRSTDQGKTWRQISDVKINGKVPVRWGQNFYWTGEQGVLVSSDQGQTWKLLGCPLAGALWGPFFGAHETAMMVVAKDGFHITADAGKTWRRVANFFSGNPQAPGAGYSVMHCTVSYGWDPHRNFLYCAPVGGSLFRLKLP